MDKDNLFDKDTLDALSALAGGMKDAYSEGLGAMFSAGAMAAEDMEPDHEVVLDIQLSASIEGHPYKVDATVVFAVELNSVLDAPDNPLNAIAAVLGAAGVDLGDDSEAVLGQLATPRIIGAVSEITLREVVLSGPDGRIDSELNEAGSLLITVDGDILQLNCESVFAFPQYPGAFAAIPSMELMQKHIVISRDKIEQPVEFSWSEPDKDNLRVSGHVYIRPVE